MGNGSALEVVLHDYALYKSTFNLLYFTSNLEQVADLLCAQANSASYAQQDGKSSIAGTKMIPFASS